MSIGPPIPEIQYFQIWPCKSKVKVIAQGHKVGITPYWLITPSFHIDRSTHSWDTAILKFDVENSRSRSWVRFKFKVKTWAQHSVESHPFFHVNRTSHSWVMTFSNFDLVNQGSRSWLMSQFKVTMWVKHFIDSHSFRSMSIGPFIPEIQQFQNIILKI